VQAKLALLTTPDHDAYISQYLTFDLKLKWEMLDLTTVNLTWLKRRAEEERIVLPALMYRNQIVSVGRSRYKALKVLEDWGLVKKRDLMSELY